MRQYVRTPCKNAFLPRGCVGETVFHVCFLQGTTIHLHLAKRLLMHFPLLLNDIYLSDEYYGENVLHMSCVAEDPSVVKWLLDIGADFNRYKLKNLKGSLNLDIQSLW